MGIRLAFGAVLAAGFGIYSLAVSADRDDTGAIVDAGDLEAVELAVGDCIDMPSEDLEEFDTVEGIPCGEPHDAEIFAVIDHPAGSDDPYPDSDGMVDMAIERCLPAFETYVGIAYDLEENLYFDFFSPTDEGWTAGDREIICLAYRIDQSKLTSSVRAEA